MKQAQKKSARRRKKFILQFQRYLESYLNHPGFRSRAARSGRPQG